MRGRIRDSSLTYCVINYIIIIYLSLQQLLLLFEETSYNAYTHYNIHNIK